MSAPAVAELLSQVRRIQIVARRQVDDLLAGGYTSVFKGRGMEFDEVREYQPGDEVRTIDWNVTARSGRPFVKRYAEERELTVLFLVDVSASGRFGSADRSKLERLVELAALLMFAALKNHDKVGLLLFAGEVVRYLPPRKGRQNVLRCLRELVAVETVPAAADIGKVAQFLGRVQKRRAVVFVLSDFLGVDDLRPLAVAAQRHDVIAVTVDDPRERALPAVGLIRLRDAESGALVTVDAGAPRVRAAFAAAAARREAALAENLRRAGLDRLALHTAEPYLQTLLRFFRMRQRRAR